MNIKLFLRISVLFFALFAVIYAMKYFSSNPFQESLNQIFNLPGKPFQWCVSLNQSSDKKIKWLDPAVNIKMNQESGLTVDQQTQKYCTVMMEDIQGVDLKKAVWLDLALGYDTEGQPVKLEWDRDLRVFKVSGLPFKSSLLHTDLIK